MPNNEMETFCVNIFKNLFKYNQKIQMDDKTEFFPILKVLIESMIENIDNEKEKEMRKDRLIEYCKRNYINIWLEQAEEDCKNGFNKEVEIKNANNQFDIYYFG